jgi:hypothetical protein
MKFIKLPVMCVAEEISMDSYKSVLKELNLEPEETVDTVWMDMYFNVEMFKEELYCISSRKSNKDHSVLELFDTRTFIVNEPVEKIVSLLDDTQTI